MIELFEHELKKKRKRKENVCMQLFLCKHIHE